MTINHPFHDSLQSSESMPLRPWTLRILLRLLERKLKRKVRSDKGIMRHTERDQWAMRWVGVQARVRFDHVRELLGRYPQDMDASPRVLSENATRHVIKRWCEQGYARFEPILAGEPGWVWLTKAGLHEADLQMTYYKPQYISLKGLRSDEQSERIEQIDKVEKLIIRLKGQRRRQVALLGFVLVIHLLDLTAVDA